MFFASLYCVGRLFVGLGTIRLASDLEFRAEVLALRHEVRKWANSCGAPGSVVDSAGNLRARAAKISRSIGRRSGRLPWRRRMADTPAALTGLKPVADA